MKTCVRVTRHYLPLLQSFNWCCQNIFQVTSVMDNPTTLLYNSALFLVFHDGLIVMFLKVDYRNALNLRQFCCSKED